MQKIVDVDEWLLSYLGAAYQWVYDRTGIYVGSCCVIVVALVMLCWHNFNLVGILVWTPWFFGAARCYMAQSRGTLSYNMFAISWRVARGRLMLAYFGFPAMAAIDVAVSRGLVNLAGDLMWFLAALLPAMLIRDRTPPEPRRKLVTSAT